MQKQRKDFSTLIIGFFNKETLLPDRTDKQTNKQTILLEQAINKTAVFSLNIGFLKQKTLLITIKNIAGPSK